MSRRRFFPNLCFFVRLFGLSVVLDFGVTYAHYVGCYGRHQTYDVGAAPEVSHDYCTGRSDGFVNRAGLCTVYQGNAYSSCQTYCRDNQLTTYFAIRRNGADGSAARCFCLNDPDSLSSDDADCTFRCTNTPNTCGGVAVDGRQAISVHTVCESPGYYGQSPSSSCDRRCYCADNAVCRLTDGQCSVDENGEPLCASEGRTGPACDQDRDECAVNKGGCEHQCHNTEGSYTCQCNTGYTLMGDRHRCVDDDECSSNNGGCEQDCKNTIGSYFCYCREGYTIDGKTQCTDQDECGTPIKGGCQQECENNAGSYRCDCLQGYTLNGDQRTCQDNDECQGSPCETGRRCYNFPGDFACCEEGHHVEEGNKVCTDKDECEENTGVCGQGQECTNIPGLFRCCPIGQGYDAAEDRCRPKEGLSMGAIIGLVAGVLVLLLLALFVGLYCRHKKMKENKSETNRGTSAQTKRTGRDVTQGRANTRDSPNQEQSQAAGGATYEDIRPVSQSGPTTSVNLGKPATTVGARPDKSRQSQAEGTATYEEIGSGPGLYKNSGVGGAHGQDLKSVGKTATESFAVYEEVDAKDKGPTAIASDPKTRTSDHYESPVRFVPLPPSTYETCGGSVAKPKSLLH